MTRRASPDPGCGHENAAENTRDLWTGRHHGQTYTLDATLFPQNICMAATCDTELAAAVTKAAALSYTPASTMQVSPPAYAGCGLRTVTETGDFDVMVGDKKAVFTYVNTAQ